MLTVPADSQAVQTVALKCKLGTETTRLLLAQFHGTDSRVRTDSCSQHSSM
jgi:hypothetical protein